MTIGLVSLACGGDGGSREFVPGTLGAADSGDDGIDDGGPSGGSTTAGDGASLDDTAGTGDEMTTGAAVEMQCSHAAVDFDAPLQTLESPLGSTDVLTFTVPGLPEAALVTSATLYFDTYDADHPGEEGEILVNGQGPYDLPADVAWDNADGQGVVDITGATVAGANVVEFGGGTVPTGNFYSAGKVRIEVTATVVECEPPPPRLPAERTVMFTEATYTERHNWVLRCDAFEYAYTASGDEHIPTDKEGLYAPDGGRTGTAIFTFPDVIPATYEVQMRSRHTVNRNPNGALFVVDGEAKRIHQDDAQDFVTDVWGLKALGGDVEVVLDSTMENQSDSVVWVRLVPQ